MTSTCSDLRQGPVFLCPAVGARIRAGPGEAGGARATGADSLSGVSLGANFGDQIEMGTSPSDEVLWAAISKALAIKEVA